MNAQELAIKLYQQLQQDDRPREMERWHASSVSQCPRAQALARRGQPRLNFPTGANILRRRAGHLIEESIRPELEKLFPNLESNGRFTSDKLDLTGEFDNYDPDSKTIIEIKSVGPRAVRYRRVDEDRHNLRDDRPYLHHEWQEHAYALLMAERGIEVEHVTYLYITLEGLLVPYRTALDPVILAQVERRVTAMNDYWERGELPPCFCLDETHMFAKSVHQYCDYKTADGCCEEAAHV